MAHNELEIKLQRHCRRETKKIQTLKEAQEKKWIKGRRWIKQMETVLMSFNENPKHLNWIS